MSTIYLDHAATTPPRPEVLQAMAEVRSDAWANPSSSHEPGRRARHTLERAREEIAALLGFSPREIHFVRGGTEANNLILRGRLGASDAGRTGSLVVSTLEHSSVREPAEALERAGARVARLEVSPRGTIDEQELDDLLADIPDLVSMQAVNSETGLRLPVALVASATARRGIPLHVDAVQAAGRVPLPGPDVGVRALTISGHKLGGPRSGAVLAASSTVSIAPLVTGGGQEQGLRAGTEDVEAAVGLARALRLALDSLESEAERLQALRLSLESRLVEAVPDLHIFAAEGPRAPHIVQFGLPGADPAVLLAAADLDGVAASVGSACRSGVPGPGPALKALWRAGMPQGSDATEPDAGPRSNGRQPIPAPLRLSLGWNTTRAEVEEAGSRLARVMRRLKESTDRPT